MSSLIFISLFCLANVFAGAWDSYRPVKIEVSDDQKKFLVVYDRQDTEMAETKNLRFSAELWDSNELEGVNDYLSELASIVYLDQINKAPASVHIDTEGYDKVMKNYNADLKNYNKKSDSIVEAWSKTLGFKGDRSFVATELKTVKARTTVVQSQKLHDYWWGFELPKGGQIILNLKIKNMKINSADIYTAKSSKSKAIKGSYFKVQSFKGSLLNGYKGLKLYYLESSNRILGIFEGWKGIISFKLRP